MTSAHRALAVLLRAAATRAPADAGALPPLDEQGLAALGSAIAAHRLEMALAPICRAVPALAPLTPLLEDAAHRQRLRMQVMLLELHHVLAALEAAGLKAMVLKGAALALEFGKPRFFSDLDLLVPRPDLERAAAEIQALGFDPDVTVRSREYYDRHHFHRVLRSPAGITLELHWALVRPSDYFSLQAEGVLARARSVAFDGIAMPVPSHADHLLHAAQQALREGFSDARRVLDAHVLLGAGAAEDPDLAARAQQGGLSTPLWVLLSVTRALTGAEAPVLLEELQPARLRRASLRSLDLPGLVLERRSATMAGLPAWLRLVCAPRTRVAMRALRTTVFPGERGLMEDGYDAEKPPGLFRRSVLSLKRMGRTAKLTVYQAWRLCAHRRAPN